MKHYEETNFLNRYNLQSIEFDLHVLGQTECERGEAVLREFTMLGILGERPRPLAYQHGCQRTKFVQSKVTCWALTRTEGEWSKLRFE